MFELRYYQREAIEALEQYLAQRGDNPCIVLPTGSGKSYVIAEIVARQVQRNPNFRCIILAHRQELVEQNYSELRKLVKDKEFPTIGIYAAGLDCRMTNAPITYAMINSVKDKVNDFSPFDVVIVDEAHHIPIAENGMYRTFINAARQRNPKLRIIGLTATPYRMGCGHVCHKDYILNEVCYEVRVGDLIRDGFLCLLRSRVFKQLTPNLNGITKQNGDYKEGELNTRVLAGDLVERTVKDAIEKLDAENRRCCIWFCVTIEHCQRVYNALLACGQNCAMVTKDTPKEERERVIQSFRAGGLRHLLNVTVFTEGFNVKQVDAIMLLRPTLSRGQYVQMVGRGLRKHESKTDCLVLDYAHCIQEHGPIDCDPMEVVPMEICPRCGEYFPRSLDTCPRCHYGLTEEIKRVHAENDEKRARLRRLHEDRISCDDILEQYYEGNLSRNVVNREDNVKPLLVNGACLYAHRDRSYAVWKACASERSPIGSTRNEFEVFIERFLEYAKDAELKPLPKMFEDYFGAERLMHSDDIIRRRRERAKENYRFNRLNGADFERMKSETLRKFPELSSWIDEFERENSESVAQAQLRMDGTVWGCFL